MSRFDNVAKLSDAWEAHCSRDVMDGHTPVTDGGTASFDTNLSGTYIECCVPRCKWAASLRDGNVIETPRTTGFAPSRIPRDYQEFAK